MYIFIYISLKKSNFLEKNIFREIVGFPIACEGDVDGALGCLIGKLLGLGTVYLSDWLEHDQSTITLWHGGMAPIQVKEIYNYIFHYF